MSWKTELRRRFGSLASHDSPSGNDAVAEKGVRDEHAGDQPPAALQTPPHVTSNQLCRRHAGDSTPGTKIAIDNRRAAERRIKRSSRPGRQKHCRRRDKAKRF